MAISKIKIGSITQDITPSPTRPVQLEQSSSGDLGNAELVVLTLDSTKGYKASYTSYIDADIENDKLPGDVTIFYSESSAEFDTKDNSEGPLKFTLPAGMAIKPGILHEFSLYDAHGIEYYMDGYDLLDMWQEGRYVYLEGRASFTCDDTSVGGNFSEGVATIGLETFTKR